MNIMLSGRVHTQKGTFIENSETEEVKLWWWKSGL